jgi:hypothetical protein
VVSRAFFAQLCGIALLCGWLFSFSGCRTVKSVVPGLGNGSSAGGDRQHLPVTSEEAVVILSEIAPQHGWEVVSTGDEFDINGPRGKYFRLEIDRTIGGKKSVSGVFYNETNGCYVIVSDKNGLPEALVEPLIAAVKDRKGIAHSGP